MSVAVTRAPWALCLFLDNLPMKTVNVSGLKNNPSGALRDAQGDVVVVMNRDRPDALMVGLAQTGTLELPGVRLALATALYRDGQLSLARAARVGQVPVAAFIAHVSRLGIAVVDLPAADAARDLDTLDAWLASS
jgi:predicted HTH domain antitoxin